LKKKTKTSVRCLMISINNMINNQSKIEKLIGELCSNGVEFKELREICLIKTGQMVSKTDILQNTGKFPVINSGRDPLGFINKYNTENDPIGITTRGAGVGSITWCVGKYFRGNLNYSVTINNTNKIITRFLYYILLQDQRSIKQLATYQGIPALNKGNLEKLQIPLPPLAVQEEIVKILDNFTELEAELEAELEERQKQYDYYRKYLMLSNNEGEWKTLDDIYDFQYGEGNTIPKTGGEYPVYGGNRLAGQHDKYNSEDAPVIGHIGAYAGIVNWVKGKHFVTYNGVICKIKANINPRYGYYLLLLQDFRSQAHAGSQPFVSYNILKNATIQILDLPYQNSIVSKLDKFEALVNDISIGLPAEITARRKQYEYYREQLLTFKELKK